MTIRCAVIGAGVIGACIALRLSRGGAAVTVIEAAGPGAGATGKSFAWIGASAPGLREPEPYFRLNALGVHAYRRLEAECDLAGTVTRTGCLTWSTDGDGQEAVASTVGHLREVGYNAITLPAWRAARDLEPAISVPDDNTPVAFYADEGYVSGPPFVGRVLSHAQAAGAALIMDDPAAGFEYSRGGAVTGVQLRSGVSVPADVVVVAAGRGSRDLLAAASFDLPFVSADTQPSAAVGLLVISRPLPAPPRRVLIADGIMIRPDGGGRLLIHDYRADELVRADTPVTPVPDVAAQLLKDTARHLPGAGPATVESVRIGIRSLPADDLPVVGTVPGVDNLYVCVAHSGVTLAPLLGEMVTDEVLTGASHPLLQSFRPARFAAAA